MDDTRKQETMEYWVKYYREGAESLIREIQSPNNDVYWGKLAIIHIFIEKAYYHPISEHPAYFYLLARQDNIIHSQTKLELIVILIGFIEKLK